MTTTPPPDTVTTVCCGTDFPEDSDEIRMADFDWYCSGPCPESSEEAA